MAGFALVCLLLFAGQFPRPGSSGVEPHGRDQSWISGQVKTQGGDPLPQATISIQTLPDASRADQHNPVSTWPGTDLRVKLDGTFRVAVPGDATFQVCAVVPGKRKQCRTVDVHANDLEVVEFAF